MRTLCGKGPVCPYCHNHHPLTSRCRVFSTLNAAYTEIIASLASTAQDHVNIADSLTSQVVDVLKAVERKNEETKKKVAQSDVCEC